MSSRDDILAAVKKNQPEWGELPPLPGGGGVTDGVTCAGVDVDADMVKHFLSVLEGIGGGWLIVSDFGAIETILREQFPKEKGYRITTGCPELAGWAEVPDPGQDPHALENVELAILRAHFAVAENGACWITEDQMIHRALPFITQHLALVIDRKDVVADMHAAYERIAAMEGAAATGGTVVVMETGEGEGIAMVAGTPAGYGFATFIAGPSKTADIEQSLVLGAHGPRSMTVFLLDE